MTEITKKKTPTIKTVAETAGVSPSTVSRIFNDVDFATPEIRNRVLATAKRLGYSRLRRRARHASTFTPTDTLGDIILLANEEVLKGTASDWIYRDITPTLHHLSAKYNYHLIFSAIKGDVSENVKTFSGRNIGGFLLMAHGRTDLLTELSKIAPVVVIHDNTSWPPTSCVVINNRMTLFKAVEHLRQLGHRRIGYFTHQFDDNDVFSRERCSAYHEAMNYFHLESDPGICFLEPFGVDGHSQAVANVMDRLAAMDNKPTAIITFLRYGISFLNEARKRSVSVPGDLSIIAIDSAPVAEWMDPPLTVVDCEFGRCAKTAIELLVEMKRTSGKHTKTVLIEPTLIARGSTGPNHETT